MPDETSDRRKDARQAIGGGIWTMAERVVSQAGQLIVFIAAARILSPAEFGVFALVSACAILTLRFAEVGWAQYIMSWSGDETVPRQVLLVAMLSGLVMALLGGLAGLALPAFGLSGEIALLVKLFALWVLLATASAAQKGIMIWQHRLKRSALCEIAGELAGLAVALWALFGGWGVIALALGRLAYQSVHLAISFAITRMTPLGGMRGAALRDLIRFSGTVFSSRMIINIRLYAATFIIGGFLGPAAVGFYRAADRLVGAVGEVIGVPTQVLAWSLFRQARDRAADGVSGFQGLSNLFFRVLLAISLPVFIWMALVAEDLVIGLIGEEWLPALPVIAILALARALWVPGMATEPILALAGEIRRLPPFTLAFLAITVALTLIAAPFGIYAVAWSQVLLSILSMIGTFWLYRRYAAIDGAEVARHCLRLIPAIALGAAALWVARSSGVLDGLPHLLRALVLPIPALIVYAAALALVEPELRALALRRLRRGARS